MDAVSYVLALSEIAYGCASTAVVMSVHNSICCEAIVKFGTEEQKKKWLPPMCTGEIIGAFGLTEPGAGSDPSSQRTTAVLDGDEWVINGTKQFITTGSHAGLTIVTAYTDKDKKHRGISAFLVPKGTPGLIVGKAEEKLGLKASDTVQLILEDCRVPADNMLGNLGDGFIIAMTCLDSGRIGISAQSVGVARACLDEAIDFVETREQFGKPISDFPGHPLAHRRHRHRDRSRRDDVCKRGHAQTGRTPLHRRGLHGQAVRQRNGQPQSPANACKCTAATAFAGSTTSSATSGTPGCSPSTRAPARSSAWSSATRSWDRPNSAKLFMK